MKCPNCQADALKAQNFCGGCGHPLQRVCSGCGATSPLSFRFCGQCGKNLADVGNMVLDRAGIVLEADQTALEILSKSLPDVKGRPFSFFVSLDDMVIFFSNWNELVRTRQRRNMEIELKADPQNARYAQIELSIPGADSDGRYHLGIADITDHRQARDKIQDKHDLINLIFSISSDLAQIDSANRKLAICDVLEKICLFVGAHCGFVSRIHRPAYQLEAFCRWHHPEWQTGIAAGSAGVQMKTALGTLRHVLAKLQLETVWIVDDLRRCSEAEQREIQAWQGIREGALLLHAIHSRHLPIGVLGLIAGDKMMWPQETVFLAKLVSQLLADAVETKTAAPPSKRFRTVKRPLPVSPASLPYDENRNEGFDDADLNTRAVQPVTPSGRDLSSEPAAADAGQPTMTFEPDAGDGALERQRVVAGDDGAFRISCPACRRQAHASADVFAELGFSLKAGCPCGESFSIMREQRRSFRKKVQLEGFFSRIAPGGQKRSAGSVWGPIMVKDLSKDGLGFTSGKAGMLRTGHSVLLQFHLDNDTQTLIKKNALVKSVNGDTVGCQFVGSDRYDVSLGFYFL